VTGRDAVLLLNAVLASLATLEEAVGSLESLSRALPGLGENAGDGAMLDIRALHATAAAITTAGKDLKDVVTTVEGNLARQTLLDDTRKFAGRLKQNSPGVRALRAKSVGPFGSPIAKGMSPRR
jgi:type II secretory pathway component PulM